VGAPARIVKLKGEPVELELPPAALFDESIPVSTPPNA
jgi:hypothetical protein